MRPDLALAEARNLLSNILPVSELGPISFYSRRSKTRSIYNLLLHIINACF
jgi:hypothetical protein